MAYEREADRDQNRKIGAQYRKLLAETNAEEEPEVMRLKDKLTEANKLFTQVKEDMPREAVLDAKLLRQLSISGLRKAEGLQTNMLTFEPNDFCRRMAKFISTSGEAEVTDVSGEDWALFGDKMSCLFKRSPAFHFLYGSFPSIPPEPKVRAPKAKTDKNEAEAKKTAPQTMKEMGKNDEEVTTEEVERVLHILRSIHNRNGRKAIGYYEFVCHPTSFSQSIQNIFHTSFLVKDGYARIFLDENELPAIEPLYSDNSESIAGSQATSSETGLVISVTQDEWKEIVHVFQIKHPAIPPTSK